MAEQPIKHGHQHGLFSPDRMRVAPFRIKVRGDKQIVIVEDAAYRFLITEDMHEDRLLAVEAYVTTVSAAGDLEIQIRNVNQAVDMLSTVITIAAGDLNSRDSAPAVINVANSQVLAGEHVAIDVDSAGSGARGLGVRLHFE